MLHRFALLLLAPLAFAADVRVIEEIAVKVNGEIITKGEIAERQVALREALKQEQHLAGPQLEQAYTRQAPDLLRGMIDELLLVQKGKELDLKVESDVNRQIAGYQLQSKITDPDKFHEYIRQQLGIPFEEFKDKITNQELTRRVVSIEVSSHVNVPEPELQKYYEAHKAEFVRKEQLYLSQILISTEGKTPVQVAAAEARAKDIVARARKGEKFTDLVAAYSDDPETARGGGQLPPYDQHGMMRKEIPEDTLFSAKKGLVTDPIKVPEGFLILRVDEHFDAGQASFDEVKDQIHGILAQPKMADALRSYLTRLRSEAFLEIKDGYVDTGAAPGKDTRWHEVVGLKPETTTKEEVASHRKRKKLLGVIPHGSVAPGTREVGAATASAETAAQRSERAAAQAALRDTSSKDATPDTGAASAPAAAGAAQTGLAPDTPSAPATTAAGAATAAPAAGTTLSTPKDLEPTGASAKAKAPAKGKKTGKADDADKALPPDPKDPDKVKGSGQE